MSAQALLLRASARSAGILFVFAVIATALLAYTFDVTRGAIADNEAKARLRLIGQILPASLYDNELMKDTVTLPASRDLGTRAPTTAYVARRQGQPVALVMEAVAPDGYSGDIGLILAVNVTGELTGVRVVSHKETPGLGDYVEIGRSAWVRQFDGKSLQNTPAKDWKVKKDGGRFDYVAGATVTPRAVVKAVYKAQQYVAQNKDKLLAPAAAGGAR